MKRFVVLLTVVMMITMIFVSCGPAKAAKPNIGITIYKFDDNFMSIVRNHIDNLARAVGEDKLDYSIQDGQGDQSKQNDLIDQFLTNGATALALNMVEPASAAVVIAQGPGQEGSDRLFQPRARCRRDGQVRQGLLRRRQGPAVRHL